MLTMSKGYVIILVFVWFTWASLALFACAESTLILVKAIFKDIVDFKEEIGRYIAFGIGVGIITLPAILSLFGKQS
ncbi:hypothetical protein [Gynuella sunshinyii]|uniref:hypothetical protein n=1 Tax=Gynuella sunshinyii TaxID=1445505 RepID=UPI0011854BA4|nr:hypothetical protein [Gynuella sunshinyii]